MAEATETMKWKNSKVLTVLPRNISREADPALSDVMVPRGNKL